jgi:hypothetical protein
MDAEGYLRRYFEVHHGRVRNLEEAGYLLQELHIAAEALVSVGAIREESAEEILGGFRDRLDTMDHDGVFVGPRSAVGTVEEVGPYAWGDPFFGHGPATSLIRVIPVAQEGVIDSFRITVISVELWSDHIGMRSMITAEEEPASPIFLWTWTVQDDRGGLYGRGGGQAGGSGLSFVSDLDFHPAADPQATALTLRARRIRPIEAVDPARMVSASGIPAEELLRFEVSLT